MTILATVNQPRSSWKICSLGIQVFCPFNYLASMHPLSGREFPWLLPEKNSMGVVTGMLFADIVRGIKLGTNPMVWRPHVHAYGRTVFTDTVKACNTKKLL